MIAALLLPLLLSASQDSTARGGLEIYFSAVLQVEEPEKTAEALAARAEAAGGYFSRRSPEYIELRVPAAKTDAFIDSLPGLGLVLDRNLQTRSVESEWTDLVSRLKAKKATLQDYYAILKESSDS